MRDVHVMFENDNRACDGHEDGAASAAGVDAFLMEKLHSTLRQTVRDWSTEGK